MKPRIMLLVARNMIRQLTLNRTRTCTRRAERFIYLRPQINPAFECGDDKRRRYVREELGKKDIGKKEDTTEGLKPPKCLSFGNGTHWLGN